MTGGKTSSGSAHNSAPQPRLNWLRDNLAQACDQLNSSFQKMRRQFFPLMEIAEFE
jgi:hypothetical protein